MNLYFLLLVCMSSFLCSEGYRTSSSYEKEEYRETQSKGEHALVPLYHHINKHPQINKGNLVTHISSETVQTTQRIRSAIKVIPVDEDVLIDVFSSLTPTKAQKIQEFYDEYYDGDLKDEFERKLSGPFMQVIVSFLMAPRELDAYWINQALEDYNVDKSTLIGIFAALHNEDLADAKVKHDEEHIPALLQELKAKLTGDFQKLMFTLANSYRQFEGYVEDRLARKDAMDMAGKLASTDPKDILINVFSTRSFETLRATFKYFEQYAQKDVIQYITSKFSGDFQKALIAIATRAQHKDRFFVDLLRNSIYSKNYNLLTWVMMSRSKLELNDISNEYSRDHRRTLGNDITKNTSGSFQKILLKLLGWR